MTHWLVCPWSTLFDLSLNLAEYNHSVIFNDLTLYQPLSLHTNHTIPDIPHLQGSALFDHIIVLINYICIDYPMKHEFSTKLKKLSIESILSISIICFSEFHHCTVQRAHYNVWMSWPLVCIVTRKQPMKHTSEIHFGCLSVHSHY